MPNAAETPRPLSPFTKAWRALCLLGRFRLSRKLGTLITEGYLTESGWVRSVLDGKVVDLRGESRPWLTIPFVSFLESRLRADWHVFEYGAGASTLYFARRVHAVAAVEHDESFAQGLRPQLPGNVRLQVQGTGSTAYAGAIRDCGFAPDLVLVDGVDREACVRAARPVLHAGAVLVLDDAERGEYLGVVAYLRAEGFRSVEFWGLAPGMVHAKCTTVFYRSENVLGL